MCVCVCVCGGGGGGGGGKCCIESLPSEPKVKYFSQGNRYTVQLPLDRTFRNHLSWVTVSIFGCSLINNK